MSGKDFFTRIFEQPAAAASSLLFTSPTDIIQQAESPVVGAWQLLRGAKVLRGAHQTSPANDWLNHAAQASTKDEVFSTELLGEAAHGLHERGRLKDAFNTANSALAIWRDLCDEAIAARSADDETAEAFAARLEPMFLAAGMAPPTDGAILIHLWLGERAVVSRADTANLFIRLLAGNGHAEAARAVNDKELDWLARNFTSPAGPATEGSLPDRSMSEGTRRGLYELLLAKGEVELAAGAFQASADAFAEATRMYEGHAVDSTDINRLLRAKFNQANSLLRLDRLDEAMDIYKLCEHGFGSVGTESELDRVRQAILWVRSRQRDALDHDN